MNRRDFVQHSAAGAAVMGGVARGMPPRHRDFDLEEVGIAELQARMTTGRTTARRLVDQYVDRIDWLDRRGPRVGHVLQVNPDARALADALDRERRTGRVRGPLHGIPVLLKDNIATGDRMDTTAGSLAPLGRPTRDAPLVTRLREAGAVVLGKTNLSEFANYRSTRSTSGWSSRGGQCRNPHALDRTPSGSSSGSAVAAAASSCAAAVGTETNGSIVSPSSACGCVGIKPTVGLVSRAGVIPIAHSQDTAGPIARTVADAAALLTALAGTDPADPATAEADARRSDYSRALDADGLRGARIGVMRPTYFGPRVDALYAAALAVLQDRGAVLVDPVAYPPEPLNGTGLVLSYEFKADLERYLAEWASAGPVRTLEDIIAFNARERSRAMPYFEQEILERSAARGPLSTPEYVEALERVQRLTRAAIDGLCDAHRLDAILAPTTGPARPIDLVSGDAGGGGSSTFPAVAGYPHITLPMGFVFGLPVGLSFIGKAWTDATLVRLAFGYEQASRMRRPPTYAAGPDVPWDGRGR